MASGIADRYRKSPQAANTTACLKKRKRLSG
jgi:hypothetical protein